MFLCFRGFLKAFAIALLARRQNQPPDAQMQKSAITMNIKTKLYAGLGFLALLIVLLWGSGLIFINTLSETSSAIIQNNARSITYMENMEQALSKLYLLQTSILTNETSPSSQTAQKITALEKRLLRELSKEQENLTEVDEKVLANKLQEAILQYFDQFERLGNQNDNLDLFSSMTRQYKNIQGLLGQITYLNLNAIHQKNEIAQETASNVILYMTILGAISSLLAIVLLIRFPVYIVNPVRELIDRMRKISDGNYDQRLEFETGDEFEKMAMVFNTMAQKLQEYEHSNIAKLKSGKQRIEAIINHMREAVIGLDENKNLLFINAKAEELVGIKRDVLVGRYAPDVASTNDLMRKLIQDLMNGKQQSKQADDEFNILKIVSNGEQVSYYSKELTPVLYANADKQDEKRIGSIITLKNVTRFQEMDEAKTDFIAVVSHELKTPIASIGMNVRLMKDKRVGQLNEQQKKIMGSIDNDVRRMKKTTLDLLDLSKVETGNIQIDINKTRPLELIEAAYETMIVQAQQKNIQLHIDCDEQLPQIKADLQKTVWVLVNLISNAIRHTSPDGSIKLKATEVAETVQFSVADTGKGISPEYLDKIFQKYFQVHGDQNGNGGSGLGLPIAKKFINAQGGEIDVESELGKGSTFYFTLPKDH